jgi:hypothetical protein
MTPKEKANQLCMRFLIQTTTNIPYGINKAIAKECALIAVDEILNVLNGEDFSRNAILFWSSVKKEIEAL